MAEKKTKEKRFEELSKKLADTTNNLHNAYLEELIHTVKRTGDYIITFALEKSEGHYVKQSDGEIDWETPENYVTMHAQVIVQDRDDKRFVPYLDVNVRIYNDEGELVTESDAPFMWHPFAYHYGFDTVLPDDGQYYAEITIKSPDFDRHHMSHGKRYTDDVTVKMSSIDIILPGGGDEEMNV